MQEFYFMKNYFQLSILILYFVSASFISFLGGQTPEIKSFPEKPMVVVIPSYNNRVWFVRNLNSVLSQNYSNYRVIYLNDCSKDGTGQAIELYLKKNNINFRAVHFDDSFSTDISTITQNFVELINKENYYFTLVHNINRCGALENLYRAIYSCADQEIVVTLDGDDWFYDSDALAVLNRTYSSGNVWLTHGSFMEFPFGHVAWSEPIPENIISKNAFREFKCASHLRTFYAWLFKKIKLEDLLYNGKFFPMTWDMAMMYPMIEMAGERHAFISTLNYVYNMANPINDNKVDNQGLQVYLDRYIRKMPRYQRLNETEL